MGERIRKYLEWHARLTEKTNQRKAEQQAAKQARQDALAQQAANRRAAQIADATDDQGVIRAGGATWDGRVLRVNGQQRRPADTESKTTLNARTIPLQQIAALEQGAIWVTVSTASGIEYRFAAGKKGHALAAAVEDALVAA